MLPPPAPVPPAVPFNGHKREEYPSGDAYEGAFKRGLRHGVGTYYCADGCRYEGEFLEGKMEGKGSYFYLQDERYEGEWHESQRHGYGTFTYSDGATYEGRWEADLRHGQGLMRYKDGSMYTGTWTNDRRHGQGQMTFADGGHYSGAWENDARHGQGTMKLPNGSNYEGEYVEDIPSGEGILWDVDAQSLYSGNFQDGLRHGVGTCEYKKLKEKFVGEWKEGARLEGLMHLADEEVERVAYVNDILVRREKLTKIEQEKILGVESITEPEEVQSVPPRSSELFQHSFNLEEDSAAERAAEAEGTEAGPPEAVRK